MSPRIRNLFLTVIVALIVVIPAFIEDWYGRTYYADDAISYIDVSKALARGDWAQALNPYWSIGYPALLTATRWMFPAGPLGEWIAIHAVNLVLFVAIYLSFLYFLRVATLFAARITGAPDPDPRLGRNGFLFTIGTAIFLLWQLQIGNVSRVSPDPLISGLFFLVAATALKFYMRPAFGTAMVLGFLMGLGYLLKAVFLPVSVGILAVMFLHSLFRSGAERTSAISKLACAPAVLALVIAPYVVALSKNVGTFTFGQSGSLNYAWNVNHMPRNISWQGGTEPFGTPIHPTHLVMKNPPVFVFAEPYAVTYPPWFNPPYWFDGYHHFFSVRNQTKAFMEDISTLRRFFFEGRFGVIKVVVWTFLLAVGLLLLKERREWWKRLAPLWPLYLLSAAGIFVYLMVVIEPRYVVGFLIVLFVTPFIPLFAPTPLISRRQAAIVSGVIAIGCALILVQNKQDVLHRWIQGQSFADDTAWTLGTDLTSLGIQPGDKVASVEPGGAIDCTWAFVGGVHIVAEIGNDAYDFDHQKEDIELFAENPDIQGNVLECFRQAGAKIVVFRYHPKPPVGSGWVQAPGTTDWVHFIP